MKFLVTGSAGHLGEALVRTLRDCGHDVLGLDVLDSEFTNQVSSVTHRPAIRSCMKDVQVVFHAATLHKPHLATHSRQEFIDANVTGTLNLLEEACLAGVRSFVYTSTTSVFGDALVPPPGLPSAWITEEVRPVPKNIYGVTKAAAEDLCQLFYRNQGLPCIVLRTSRFFPEEDDNPSLRTAFDDLNLKANEYLYRRVDIHDVVSAHLRAAERATEIGFGKYIISATTPFRRVDVERLRNDVQGVVQEYVPEYTAEYSRRKWKLPWGIDRVYVNERARNELGWIPQYDFRTVVNSLKADNDFRSPLALVVGSKGYHAQVFSQGPYPVE